MSSRINRRHFLKTAALGSAMLGLSSRADDLNKGAPTPTSGKKLNVAFIGAAGRAEGNLNGIDGTGSNIVALCDIDMSRLKKSAAKYSTAHVYSDYRKMLEEQKDIEAVVVSTPDHTHAVAAMMAMKMGKPVYVEKPMCHDIYETRMLTEAARKYKVATQMGNHGTASEYIRRQAEWVQSGDIGTVKEIHCWSNRPTNMWPQGVNRPLETPPVPEGIFWDLWLGTAPERPYNPAYHPFKWRGFWDFGTGALGDMGCHIMNYPYYTFRFPAPVSVECVGMEGATSETGPNWSVIRWDFPAVGDQPARKLFWHDGGKMPEPPKGYWLSGGKKEEAPKGLKKMPTNGTLYVGDKGTILAPYSEAPALVGDDKYRGPKPTLPKSPGHHKEFVDACKGGPAAGSNFDYAGPLTEIVLLGNVAIRAGQRIQWDSANMKIPNLPEAEKYVKREYRKGWEL